jgi:hypothetical protein
MKYRMLTDEELRPLEEDLKHFLIVNGIHDTEWEKMNREEPEKALALVGVFSDTVLQKVYEKLEFLEFRKEDACYVFHLTPDAQEMIVIDRKKGSEQNLSTVEGIHHALTRAAGELSFFRSRKTYTEPREETIHKLLESGCVLSSKDFWEALESGLS